MADPLEVGDQGGQLGPDQAASFDPDWKRGLVELLTTWAPPGMTVVLLDRQRHVLDVNLLDHTGLAPERGFQPMAAPGAKIDTMIERSGVYGLSREWVAFVFGVSGLATDLALSLTIGWRRLGWLDDVRGRGLGRRRRILPRAASCSWSLATAASSAASRAFCASNCAWSRRQFEQDFRALAFMARYAKSMASISPQLYR